MRIYQHSAMFTKPPFVRKRKDEISLVVVHHNAGGGNAAATYRALRGRYLSCHYVVEASGRVVQLVDDSLVALHAGKVNGRSIGIECQGRGFLGKRNRRDGERYYTDELHGKTRNDWIAFTEPQRGSLIWLVLHLCMKHRIPTRMPTRAPGEALRGVYDDWPTYAGVLTHYMLTRNKMDCPPREADWIARALEGAPLPV